MHPLDTLTQFFLRERQGRKGETRVDDDGTSETRNNAKKGLVVETLIGYLCI